jgi:hypothetical protein
LRGFFLGAWVLALKRKALLLVVAPTAAAALAVEVEAVLSP